MSSTNRLPSKNRAGVLVLSPDADEYLRLLEGRMDGCAAAVGAHAVERALESRADFPVILGQPDLVARYLAAGRDARWVQSTWAGVTPLLKLGRRDFVLTGVKDVFGPQVAEYVLGYLLAHELKLLERLGRQANRSWWPEPGGTLAGKTMGIMGTGSIGRHLAEVAGRFGLTVTGLNRGGGIAPGFERVFPVGRLAGFLAEADYLVCTLPQTPHSDGLLDADAFRALKPGCYLVNVGRGSVIDEDALLQALESGTLSGAVLDVFRQEPLPRNHPLWHAPETLVTAHVAAKSHARDIVEIFVENHHRFLRGEELRYRIEFERGY